MQLVDRPEIADFVLADDYGATPGNACRSPAPVKTIKVDSETRAPDVTVSLGAGDTLPDYGSMCIRCGSRTRTSPHCSPRSGRRNSRCKLAEQRVSPPTSNPKLCVSAPSTLTAVHPAG